MLIYDHYYYKPLLLWACISLAWAATLIGLMGARCCLGSGGGDCGADAAAAAGLLAGCWCSPPAATGSLFWAAHAAVLARAVVMIASVGRIALYAAL